jgi:molybdopterin adenylyltransferase
VVTVSDGVFRGTRQDTSGEIMREGLVRLGATHVERAVVPDDGEAIVAKLVPFCDGPQRVDLVVTVGGTGLGPRDVTPEATAEVVKRWVPGLAEALRAYGARHTQGAYLSRGVAGLRGRTLVVNVAGSPQAARDALEVLAGLLPHALHVLAGGGHEEKEGEAAAPPPAP